MTDTFYIKTDFCTGSEWAKQLFVWIALLTQREDMVIEEV